MGKKKSKRGANLADARKAKVQKPWMVAEPGGGSGGSDDESVPVADESEADELMSEAEQEEPAVLGSRRASARAAAEASGGARETRRLDEQAASRRRKRQVNKDVAAMPSLQDCFDGTVQAKKLAAELEPADAWAEAEVVDAQPVVTGADGERLVVLGAIPLFWPAEATTDATAAGTETVGEVERPAAPKRGRPPGSKTRKSAGEGYASHRGGAQGASGNTHESKAARRELRARAAETPREYAPGGAPAPQPKQRRADAGKDRGPQLLPQLRSGGAHEQLGDRLLQIASARRFERSDFLGGELVSKEDWPELRESSWELRRVYAMAHAVALMRRSVGVVDACAAAAEAVRLGKKANGMTQTSVHTWLSQYIRAAGSITLERCIQTQPRESVRLTLATSLAVGGTGRRNRRTQDAKHTRGET